MSSNWLATCAAQCQKMKFVWCIYVSCDAMHIFSRVNDSCNTISDIHLIFPCCISSKHQTYLLAWLKRKLQVAYVISSVFGQVSAVALQKLLFNFCALILCGSNGSSWCDRCGAAHACFHAWLECGHPARCRFEWDRSCHETSIYIYIYYSVFLLWEYIFSCKSFCLGTIYTKINFEIVMPLCAPNFDIDKYIYTARSCSSGHHSCAGGLEPPIALWHFPVQKLGMHLVSHAMVLDSLSSCFVYLHMQYAIYI